MGSWKTPLQVGLEAHGLKIEAVPMDYTDLQKENRELQRQITLLKTEISRLDRLNITYWRAFQDTVELQKTVDNLTFDNRRLKRANQSLSRRLNPPRSKKAGAASF
jgi:cell division septum initiation protein DivIVA